MTPAFFLLEQDIARAVSLEVALELGRVRFVSRARAEDDATFLETALVFGGARFRNAGADQRAEQRAGRAAGARAGDRAGDRPGDEQADARNRDRGRRRDDRTERRADTDTDAAADARALGRLRAFLELGPALTSPKWRLRVSSVMTTLMSSSL